MGIDMSCRWQSLRKNGKPIIPRKERSVNRLIAGYAAKGYIWNLLVLCGTAQRK